MIFPVVRKSGCMFLGIPDPHPDSLVTCKAPDPSISHKSVERTEIMAAE
jgi:hypothetical protein